MTSVLERLPPADLELCRKSFSRFDKDGSGTIDAKELKAALAVMGQHPSDEDLFVMMHQIDEDGSGQIEFEEFCNAIANWRAMQPASSEGGTIDAFVALGGNPDKTGKISTDKLRSTIKEFELCVDIDQLVREVDKSDSGFLKYEEFAAILG